MTNQASEDELRYVLRHTKVTAYAAGKPYVVNLATVIQKEDIDAILALIRTEKLIAYAEGNGGFDELDFKEYLFEVWLPEQMKITRNKEVSDE
jgi:hypothetical protein